MGILPTGKLTGSRNNTSILQVATYDGPRTKPNQTIRRKQNRMNQYTTISKRVWDWFESNPMKYELQFVQPSYEESNVKINTAVKGTMFRKNLLSQSAPFFNAMVN